MIRCEIGELAKNTDVTIAITVEACVAGVVTNNAKVSGDLLDPSTGNNQSSATVTVFAGLDVTNESSTTQASLGDKVDFLITVTNVGNTEATGVMVTESFDRFAWEYVSDTGGCQSSFEGFFCDIGTLAPGEVRTFTLTFLVDEVEVDLPIEDVLTHNLVTATDDRGARDQASALVRLVPGFHPMLIFLVGLGSDDAQAAKQHGADLLDLYLGEERIADDLAPGQATGFVEVLLKKLAPMLYLVDGSASDASAPIDSLQLNLFGGESGQEALATSSLHIITTNESGDLVLLSQSNIETTATDDNQVDLVLAHADAGAAAFDLQRIDDTPQHTLLETLAGSVAFGTFTDRFALEPTLHNLAVSTADGNTPADRFHVKANNQVGVFSFDLSQHAGQLVVMVASRSPSDSSFVLAAYDANGAPVEARVVTAVDEAMAQPHAVALHGNYPNPFELSTTLVFDLPARAEVEVQVFDLLGRQVLVLPVQSLGAGARQRVGVDASTWAAGTYLYRLSVQTPAETQVKTGRMVRLK